MPRLLCEKTYLKPRIECMIFIYKKWFYIQKCLRWAERKNPWKNAKTNKNKEKIPHLVALTSPPALLRYGSQFFSGVREHRKQSRPTLSGWCCRIVVDWYYCTDYDVSVRNSSIIDLSAFYMYWSNLFFTSRMWHKINFWEEFNRFELSFLSRPRLKNPVCPTTYPLLEGD